MVGEAAAVADGAAQVWLNPNSLTEIGGANSRLNIRKLVKNGMIRKRLDQNQSRARTRALHEAKSKGRHTGPGKR